MWIVQQPDALLAQVQLEAAGALLLRITLISEIHDCTALRLDVAVVWDGYSKLN